MVDFGIHIQMITPIESNQQRQGSSMRESSGGMVTISSVKVIISTRTSCMKWKWTLMLDHLFAIVMERFENQITNKWDFSFLAFNDFWQNVLPVGQHNNQLLKYHYDFRTASINSLYVNEMAYTEDAFKMHHRLRWSKLLIFPGRKITFSLVRYRRNGVVYSRRYVQDEQKVGGFSRYRGIVSSKMT